MVQMTAEKVGNGNRWNCQDTIKSDSETVRHTVTQDRRQNSVEQGHSAKNTAFQPCRGKD